MSASVSPHGFETVRGRGYRPEDVDRRVEEVSIDRDAHWERAARLTVLCNEMDAELAELQEQVAKLPPQNFEGLGEQARLLLTTAQSEADRLKAEAESAGERIRDEAMAYADRLRDQEQTAARELRAEAEEYARRTEEAARKLAAELAAEAAQDAEQWRAEAAAVLTEMRRRTEQMWHEEENRQAEEWDLAGRELAKLEAETAHRVAELDARCEAKLTERRRAHARVEEAARHTEEEAADRAAEILAEAKVEADRIERDTARLLREHEEERTEVRAHMAHVRNSLAALTGKDPDALDEDDDAGEGEPAAQAQEQLQRPTEPQPQGRSRAEKVTEPEPEAAGEPGSRDGAGDGREPDGRDAEGRGPGEGGLGDGGAADRQSGSGDPGNGDPDNEDTLETELPRLETEPDTDPDTEEVPRVEG